MANETSDSNLCMDISLINQAFLLGVLKINPVISDRTKKIQKSFWRDLFPRGEFPYGQGLVERVNFFEGMPPEQAGLTQWKQIVAQTVVDAQGNVTADPCDYSRTSVLNYGFTTKQFTGFERMARTKWICLNEIKWKWQFQEQLRLIFEGLADYTLSVWETHARETYLSMAKKYVLTNDPFASEFTYDPFASTDITLPDSVTPQHMTPEFLRYVQQWYALQAEKAALGNESGVPSFGLVCHPADFDYMIHRDQNLHNEYLWSQPDLLIDGYGKVKSFKNWGLMFDMLAPRFKISAHSGGTTTYSRVLPYTTLPTTVGEMVKADPEYIRAEYTIVSVMLKNVFEVLVPPFNPPNPGGGTQFVGKPSFNGEFHWLNIISCNENPLGEKGYYFSRYQAFVRPGPFSIDMACFLCKRCPQIPTLTCVTDASLVLTGATALGTASSVNILEATAIDPTGANSYNQVTVRLSAQIACGTTKAVTVASKNAGATVTALISDDVQAGSAVYRLVFATNAAWVSKDNGLVGGTVICA